MKIIRIGENEGTIEYTGNVVAMFSPQLLRVSYNRNTRIQVTINNTDTDEYIQEERYPVLKSGVYVTEFDLSRMIQIVSDTEGALENVPYDATGPDTHSEKVQIQVRDGNAEEIIDPITIEAIYSACDGGESIGNGAETMRFYPNYPQTIPMGENSSGLMLTSEETILSFARMSKKHLLQLNLMMALEDNLCDADLDSLRGGFPVEFNVSWGTYISNGQEQTAPSLSYKKITMMPDNTPFGKGVYLRWMQRDGTIGYWLFTKSKKTFSASASKSFSRHLSGIEAEPDNGGVIRNRVRTDYAIGESLTIGTGNVTEREYEMLCGLASSPVVDMLVGGSADNPVWKRVNVVAGSYTRSFPKSGLARVADFELTINLPSRNAITF